MEGEGNGVMGGVYVPFILAFPDDRSGRVIPRFRHAAGQRLSVPHSPDDPSERGRLARRAALPGPVLAACPVRQRACRLGPALDDAAAAAAGLTPQLPASVIPAGATPQASAWVSQDYRGGISAAFSAA